MIENLARHIEWLLGENDCVIVPGLGGFIAHYTPARRIEAESRFLPPTRIVAFNPSLKINDGLLVQSYMLVEGIGFVQALKSLERDVEQLFVALHETGKVVVGHIGELRCSLRGVYSFIPFDNCLEAPALYGLSSFEMFELKALEEVRTKLARTVVPVVPVSGVRSSGRWMARFKLRSARTLQIILMVAMVALFFFLPAPIENTEVMNGNYARLLPEDIFKQFEQQSLAITPIRVKSSSDPVNGASVCKEVFQASEKGGKVTEAVQVKPAQETHQVVIADKAALSASLSSAPASFKHYHVIVASMSTETDARQMANRLVGEGYANACAIIADGKKRVCIESCTTEAEAYRYIGTLREAGTYKDAWVLKREL